jgi:hypothetical protein
MIFGIFCRFLLMDFSLVLPKSRPDAVLIPCWGCAYLSGQVQSLLGTDLQSPIHKRFSLAEAQKGLETYVNHMSAGKILLVANPQAVPLDG